MKKTSTLLTTMAALLVTLASCSGPIDFSVANGSDTIVPGAEARTTFAMPTSNITYMENFADLRLFAGAGAEILYSSNQEMGYSNLFIHYGFNNWQAVADAPISITNPSSPYLTGKVNVPSWATSMDYVFYSVKADGTKLWDNNQNRDWHKSVYTSSVETMPSTSTITLYYISKYAGAKIHWGLNNWTATKDTVMTKTQSLPSGYNKFSVTITPAKATDLVNFCFTNGTGAWDNNSGKNWVTGIGSYINQVYTTNNGAFNQSDLMGENVSAFLEGKYMGNFAFGGGTSSFLATASGTRGNWKYVLDVIKNGNRYTGEATKLVTGTTNVGLTVVVTPWAQ